MRELPQVITLECTEPGSAMFAVGSERLDAIVGHDKAARNGIDLIALPSTGERRGFITGVCSNEREQVNKAESDRFLNYEKW
jgi:hypothetical protein